MSFISRLQLLLNYSMPFANPAPWPSNTHPTKNQSASQNASSKLKRYPRDISGAGPGDKAIFSQKEIDVGKTLYTTANREKVLQKVKDQNVRYHQELASSLMSK